VPRSVSRRLVVLGIAALGALAGPVAIAQASDNDLRNTLNQYSPKIVRDENAVKHGLSEYPKGKSRPLTRALKREVADLHALKGALKNESGSSRKGKKAKKDIVKGLGLIASAYTALRNDVLAAHGGAVPASEVNTAVATDQRGRTKLLAGLNLLR
jgi:hypothetical protein